MRAEFTTDTNTRLDGTADRRGDRLRFVTDGGSVFSGRLSREGGQDVFDGICRTAHGRCGFHLVGQFKEL